MLFRFVVVLVYLFAIVVVVFIACLFINDWLKRRLSSQDLRRSVSAYRQCSVTAWSERFRELIERLVYSGINTRKQPKNTPKKYKMVFLMRYETTAGTFFERRTFRVTEAAGWEISLIKRQERTRTNSR